MIRLENVRKLFRTEEVETTELRRGHIDFEDMDALDRAVVSNYLYIRISEEDVPGTLTYLQDKFAGYDPAHLFEYRFLDDVLEQQYASENRRSTSDLS